MWISARTALTLALAALLLVVVAVAAPLMPRPHLPPLPNERHAAPKTEKFGAATAVLASPDRVRTQAMVAADRVPAGAAHWAGRVGSGPSAAPAADAVSRLQGLLNDARTVADPHAETFAPAWVVRFVRDEHRVDVMGAGDGAHVVVVEDGRPVGAFATDGLRREYGALATGLAKDRN